MRLRAEAPGILRWAVEGCLRWQREGLAPPADVERATAEYRSGEDALGLFLTECCLLEANARCGKTALYEAYAAWAKRSGEDTVPMREFRKALLDRGYVEERVGRVGTRCWAGVGLLADTPTRADAEIGIPAIARPREGVMANPTSASVGASARPATLYRSEAELDLHGETF